MSKVEYTPIVVRVTPSQKSVLQLLANQKQIPMARLIDDALEAYVKRNDKAWPSTPRRAAKPKPQPPRLPLRTPAGHFRWWFERVQELAAHPEQMTREGWMELLAAYQVVKANWGPLIKDCWACVSEFRAALDEGSSLPDVDELSVSPDTVRRLYLYGRIRDEWSRAPIDRKTLNPDQLTQLKAGDAARARKSRAAQRVKRDAQLEEVLDVGLTSRRYRDNPDLLIEEAGACPPDDPEFIAQLDPIPLQQSA